MNAAPGPPPHLVPVAEARAAHDRETPALSGPGEPVAEVREVVAPGPGGPIPIRIVRPEGVRARSRWSPTPTAAAGCSAP